ncbi:hypothetical protein JL720_12085 [Aureococcus anophagefferens]|nr:hypothetical protein JL720_12085 [Aureococcus anophagefferens]
MALPSDGGSAAAYYWVPVNTDDAYVLGRKSGAGFVDADSGEAIDAVAAADCYAVASPAAARRRRGHGADARGEPRVDPVLRARYGSGDIYTAMGSVLVATNPFSASTPSAPATLGRFVDPQTPDEDLEPHIWFTARRAYRALQPLRKYLEVVLDGGGRVVGAKTTNYLLEKSRVVRQAPGERGYHAFYHCVAGENARAEHPGGAVSAAALGARLGIGSRGAETRLRARRRLRSASAARLGRALVTRTISAGGRGSINVVVLAAGAAGDARDALAKALYAKLFDWAVDRVNREMEAPAGEAKTIGVLDIFGFEIFESNSFEQLCINLTNEQLQNKFNRDIFELELRLYADAACPATAAAGEAFGVVHYAGLVTYDVDQFLVKNVDQLSGDLSSCVAGSSHERTAALLTWNDAAPPRRALARRPGLRRREQDDRVKPNMEKVKRVFRSPVVLEQLTYAGVFETVTIQQSGWPFRSPHERFAKRYFVLDLKNAAALRRLGPPGHAGALAGCGRPTTAASARPRWRSARPWSSTARRRRRGSALRARPRQSRSASPPVRALVLKTKRRLGRAAATLEARSRRGRGDPRAAAGGGGGARGRGGERRVPPRLPARAFEAALERGDAVLKALEEGERLAGILEALVAKDDAAAHYDDLERALKAVDAVADPDATRGGRLSAAAEAARAQVRGVRDLMVAKRCLERGVAERSKADLEEGLLARSAPRAVSADFCAAERAAEACKDAVFAEVAAVVPPIRKRRARAPAPSRWTAARSTRRAAVRGRAAVGAGGAATAAESARWLAIGDALADAREGILERRGYGTMGAVDALERALATGGGGDDAGAERSALRRAAEDDAAADEIARALAAGAVAGVDALRRAVSAFRAPIRRSPAAPAKQASWLDAAEAELDAWRRVLDDEDRKRGLAAAMAAGAAHLGRGRRPDGGPGAARRGARGARRRPRGAEPRDGRAATAARRCARAALAKGDYDALEDAGLHFDAVVVAREAGVHGDGGGDGVVDMAVPRAEMDCLRVEVLNVRREACEAVAATPRVVGVPGAVDGSRLDPVAERAALAAHADDWDAILTKGVLDVDSAEVALLRDEASDRRDRAAALAALAEGRPRGAVGSLDVGAVDDAPLRALDGGRRSPATAGDVDLDEAALRQAAAACDVLAESERVKIHADRLRVGPACFDAAVAARDECALLRRCAALRRVARELAAAVVAGPALGAPGALDLATCTTGAIADAQLRWSRRELRRLGRGGPRAAALADLRTRAKEDLPWDLEATVARVAAVAEAVAAFGRAGRDRRRGLLDLLLANAAARAAASALRRAIVDGRATGAPGKLEIDAAADGALAAAVSAAEALGARSRTRHVVALERDARAALLMRRALASFEAEAPAGAAGGCRRAARERAALDAGRRPSRPSRPRGLPAAGGRRL